MALDKSQAQLMFRNFNHFQKVSNLISPEKIKMSQLKKSNKWFLILDECKMEKHLKKWLLLYMKLFQNSENQYIPARNKHSSEYKHKETYVALTSEPYWLWWSSYEFVPSTVPFSSDLTPTVPSALKKITVTSVIVQNPYGAMICVAGKRRKEKRSGGSKIESSHINRKRWGSNFIFKDLFENINP